jgi:hypothetical protein
MRMYIGVLALVIVYFLLSSSELYVPRILDSDWLATQNDPERKGSPFNNCSPESFEDCAKVKFPYLSRY